MSKLEDIGAVQRQSLAAKNTYNNNDEYNISHSNAVSNGDEKGKGEMNGEAGSATDIKTRNTLITKNKFKNGKEYTSA